MSTHEQGGKRRNMQRVYAIGVSAIIFLAGLYIGIHQQQTYAQSTSETPSYTLSFGGNTQPANVNFSEFWNVWSLLNQDFVQAHGTTSMPTDQDKIDGAIQGLVASYGDPYTVYLPPKDAQVFDQDISGSFGGVGMEIGAGDNGGLVVIAPLKSSPAEAAGVKTGDKIIAIDDKPTDGIAVDEAIKLIRGQKGTTVKITVLRGGSAQPIVIPITRDTIQIPVINYLNHPDTGIYEIDLYSFSANSADLFRDALRAYMQSGDTKLLLDLRGNPGGYLDAAVDMASYFLPTGSSIVTEDYKGKQDNVTHRSYGYNVFQNKKLSMAILTDQGTASAAEILSGALQQHGVAKLVGTRTFGKGSVQQLFDLSGGAELKVTVARWLTPNGTSISDGGLTPDIQATTTSADLSKGTDPQKSAAIEYLVSQ